MVPAADHLWELKQVLYDDPYPNEDNATPYPGFDLETIVPVDSAITLGSSSDIHSLFQMTPYYWKTPQTGAERLAALETLTTRISFRIHADAPDLRAGADDFRKPGAPVGQIRLRACQNDPGLSFAGSLGGVVARRTCT